MPAAELSNAGKGLLSTKTLAAKEDTSVPPRGDLRGGTEGPHMFRRCPSAVRAMGSPLDKQNQGFRSLEKSHKVPWMGFSLWASNWKQVTVENPEKHTCVLL